MPQESSDVHDELVGGLTASILSGGRWKTSRSFTAARSHTGRSNKRIERDADSTKTHRALAARRDSMHFSRFGLRLFKQSP